MEKLFGNAKLHCYISFDRTTIYNNIIVGTLRIAKEKHSRNRNYCESWLKLQKKTLLEILVKREEVSGESQSTGCCLESAQHKYPWIGHNFSVWKLFSSSWSIHHELEHVTRRTWIFFRPANFHFLLHILANHFRHLSRNSESLHESANNVPHNWETDCSKDKWVQGICGKKCTDN